MKLRVLVTGGSGFVGRAVVERLLSGGSPVTALINRRPAPALPGLATAEGGVFDPQALSQAMQDCRAVIHLVGIIRQDRGRGITFQRIHVEGTQAVVEAARRQRVRRIIFMSALGSRWDAVSEYHRTKYHAEEIVRGSGLDWTIIQPSLIHGPGGEFMEMEKQWAMGTAPPYFFMPYFGGGVLGLRGGKNVQPVFVDDVARAFAEAIDNPKTMGQTYPLGGFEPMSWPQMHNIVATALHRPGRRTMAIPAWWAKFLTHVVPGRLLPFNRDQVIMSQEDNTCDLTKFTTDFGWTPRGLAESLGGYIVGKATAANAVMPDGTFHT